MSNLWEKVADFFKKWDGEDMTKSMPLYVDDLREINSNRIDLIRLKRERKEIRDKAIDEFARKFIYKAVCSGCSGCTNCYEEERQCECEDWKSYMEIAGQMKEVGE